MRLIATAPVHVAQWATYVTTPTITSDRGDRARDDHGHEQRHGAASVTVQGVVSDPGGAALPPVTTPAQTIAAGASASFTFDVPSPTPSCGI